MMNFIRHACRTNRVRQANAIKTKRQQKIVACDIISSYAQSAH